MKRPLPFFLLAAPLLFLMPGSLLAQAASPTISSISPSQGPVDTVVTIKGSGFLPSVPVCTTCAHLQTNTVKFGDYTDIVVTSVSNDTITFMVPTATTPHCSSGIGCLGTRIVPGVYKVSVTNNFNSETLSESNKVDFTVTDESGGVGIDASSTTSGMRDTSVTGGTRDVSGGGTTATGQTSSTVTVQMSSEVQAKIQVLQAQLIALITELIKLLSQGGK